METLDLHFEITEIIKDASATFSASGEYTLIKAINLFKFAIDNTVANKKNRLLIDVTKVTGDIPLLDRYQYSQFLAEYNATHALGMINRIAVVGNDEIVHKEKFGQLVARNRGANVCVFTDLSHAVNWLDEN